MPNYERKGDFVCVTGLEPVFKETSTVKAPWYPPLNPPPGVKVGLGWSIFLAVVLIAIPFSSVLLVGYVLWCQWQSKKVCKLCRGRGWVDCGIVGIEDCECKERK